MLALSASALVTHLVEKLVSGRLDSESRGTEKLPFVYSLPSLLGCLGTSSYSCIRAGCLKPCVLFRACFRKSREHGGILRLSLFTRLSFETELLFFCFVFLFSVLNLDCACVVYTGLEL